jgi:hypothetical protein
VNGERRVLAGSILVASIMLLVIIGVLALMVLLDPIP